MPYLRDMTANFAATLRPGSTAGFRPVPAQVATALGVLIVVEVGLSALRVGTTGGIYTYGLLALLGRVLLALAALGLVAALTGQIRALATLVIVFAIMRVALLPLELMDPATTYALTGTAPQEIATFVLPLLVIAFGALTYAFSRSLSDKGRWRLLQGSLLAAVLIAARSVTPQGYMQAFYPADAYEDEETEAPPEIDTAALYSAQFALRSKWDDMRRGIPGRTEIFGLVLGGTAHESVFASEVEKGGLILAEAYDAKGRVYRLLNDQRAPTMYPLATPENLFLALNHMSGQMNEGEDWAILYLSSHGARDMLALSFWQAGVRSLSAKELSALLDASGLKNIVIVVSACYSGSFIDDLARPDRIVITAAAPDRTSFGCGDGREWTFFGEAFLANGLRQSIDPRRAFAVAQETVTGWEVEQGHKPSMPRMFVGPEMGAFLDNWLDERARKRAALDQN